MFQLNFEVLSITFILKSFSYGLVKESLYYYIALVIRILLITSFHVFIKIYDCLSLTIINFFLFKKILKKQVCNFSFITLQLYKNIQASKIIKQSLYC